jgi:hypothetical protein
VDQAYYVNTHYIEKYIQKRMFSRVKLCNTMVYQKQLKEPEMFISERESGGRGWACKLSSNI